LKEKEMPEYLAPGVYIQEMPSANKAIQGASTSTAGMVGLTERGPVGIPTLVTSAGSFKRLFGGLLDNTIYTGGMDALPHAANGFFANGGSRLYIVRVLAADAAIASADFPDDAAVPTMSVFSRSAGATGNNLRVTITHTNRVQTTLAADAAAADTSLSLTSAFGLTEGAVIDLGGATHTVTRLRPGNVIDIDPALAAGGATDDPVMSVEFDLLVEKMSGVIAVETEIFTGLNLSPTSASYAPLVIGSCADDGTAPSETGESVLIRLFIEAAPGLRPDDVQQTLAGGSDGTVDDSTFVGVASDDPVDRTGIQALANEPGISLVAVPGQTSTTVQNALLTHCEQQVYRFAVLDSQLDDRIADVRDHRGNYDSTRAALYYPWLTIADPFGARGAIHRIPPSGHMLGIYARTDNSRGVWKTPANEVVRNILGFDTAINKAEQDLLNPININCLRDFRSSQRGLRVWGGRTLSSDPEWKYIAVRRTFLFIEQSLDAGLQWAVFEPNGKALWDTVRQSITGFLDSIWRQGGLAGATQDEAFFVNVGYGVTMEQADLDNGRLIVDVGVAPLYPAEFVIIRISQKTLEAVN
jgi:phage tail sheath protein FI